jgi:hypothetical protein
MYGTRTIIDLKTELGYWTMDIIAGMRILIRIILESWIRIRIKVKNQKLTNEGVEVFRSVLQIRIILIKVGSGSGSAFQRKVGSGSKSTLKRGLQNVGCKFPSTSPKLEPVHIRGI